AAKSGPGYGAKSEPGCHETLGGDAAAWQPNGDGMRLVSADGATLISFGRWSNSLFVSHRASGVDVQLRRGG
ncbi:MAG: AprI/Inh family metalloprotease inhibitor, partial [Caulobacteraceae bacterium]|nr:AprI/Inh family metalloprotease inhibitor [Caulobacteraceae bacterium]